MAAEKGMAEAQNNLGFLYETGLGVTQNDTEAFRFYSLAAEQGEPIAMANLGFRYYFGYGVAEDHEAAYTWWKKAADMGESHGQYGVGIYDYLEKDYEQAVYWLRLAAEQGHAGAQYRLGACYYLGDGVEVNGEEAEKWWSMAAAQGDADAQKALAQYFPGATASPAGAANANGYPKSGIMKANAYIYSRPSKAAFWKISVSYDMGVTVYGETDYFYKVQLSPYGMKYVLKNDMQITGKS